MLGGTDTPHWHNRFEKGCDDYETPRPAAMPGDFASSAGGWCEAGALKREAAWAGGPEFNWPEKNCCACGKAVTAS